MASSYLLGALARCVCSFWERRSIAHARRAFCSIPHGLLFAACSCTYVLTPNSPADAASERHVDSFYYEIALNLPHTIFPLTLITGLPSVR